MFEITTHPIEAAALGGHMHSSSCGAVVTFEGRVRDHNEGQSVLSLSYEAFEKLAVKEGAKIIEEAAQRFAINKACCVHRIGHLQIGDVAIWVGVCAGHRHAAFQACEYVIEQVKSRVPIWKKEFYEGATSHWIRMNVLSATASERF